MTGKPSILIGNGMSMMVHQRFAYKSLFESLISEKAISENLASIFEILKTEDFEAVLRTLEYYNAISEKIGIENATGEINGLIDECRNGLIQAVTTVGPDFPINSLLDTNAIAGVTLCL